MDRGSVQVQRSSIRRAPAKIASFALGEQGLPRLDFNDEEQMSSHPPRSFGQAVARRADASELGF